MTDAMANEMFGLIESKENELNEARHQLSIYTDLVTRLETEVETLSRAAEILIDFDGKVVTLKKADEILINPDGRVESEHEAKDSLKANVSDFYKLLQWFKDKNALTDDQIGLRTGMSATAIRNYRIGKRLPRGKIKRALKDYMNEVGGISEDEFESYYAYSLRNE